MGGFATHEKPLQSDEAVKDLFYHYADDLYRFALYSVGNHDDAKDIVQDVFLKAYRSFGNFRQEAQCKTWLFQIAKNQIRDHFRRSRVRKTAFRKENKVPNRFTEFDSDIEIQDALSRLKENFRQVLILRFIEDLSVRDTADILHWSEAKVRTTQHRALKQLRTIFEDGHPSGKRKGMNHHEG